MHVPKLFEETRREVLYALIRNHPLGTLVTLGPGGLSANHIPFLLDDTSSDGALYGHVARANPVWQVRPDGPESLAVFQGPQAYVSPSWYPSKQEGGKVVPTWNYAVVHVYGMLRAIEDKGWLRDHLPALVAQHESARAQPWRITDAPPDYIDKMLEAIVGIEITITRMVGKWKVSQNRSTDDRRGVVQGLRAEQREQSLAVADLVQTAMDSVLPESG